MMLTVTMDICVCVCVHARFMCDLLFCVKGRCMPQIYQNYI